MVGLITWKEQSVKNNMITDQSISASLQQQISPPDSSPDIAPNDHAESRMTTRPTPCRVNFAGSREYLQKVMKKIITFVVAVVVLHPRG